MMPKHAYTAKRRQFDCPCMEVNLWAWRASHLPSLTLQKACEVGQFFSLNLPHSLLNAADSSKSELHPSQRHPRCQSFCNQALAARAFFFFFRANEELSRKNWGLTLRAKLFGLATYPLTKKSFVAWLATSIYLGSRWLTNNYLFASRLPSIICVPGCLERGGLC